MTDIRQQIFNRVDSFINNIKNNVGSNYAQMNGNNIRLSIGGKGNGVISFEFSNCNKKLSIIRVHTKINSYFKVIRVSSLLSIISLLSDLSNDSSISYFNGLNSLIKIADNFANRIISGNVSDHDESEVMTEYLQSKSQILTRKAKDIENVYHTVVDKTLVDLIKSYKREQESLIKKGEQIKTLLNQRALDTGIDNMIKQYNQSKESILNYAQFMLSHANNNDSGSIIEIITEIESMNPKSTNPEVIFEKILNNVG